VIDNEGLVTENSVITITSHTPELAEDQGIFRSKFPMSECLNPVLRQKLLGLRINDTVEADFNGAKHNITVLSIKKQLVTEEKSEQEG